MSLSAYLAGERMTANNQEDGDNMDSFGLGDRHFRPEDDQAGVINALVPGMQEQRTIDAQDFTGSSLVHGSDRFKILQDMIVGNGITLNDEFQNELSPQYQALHWMAYNDGFQPSPNDPLSIQKIIQRYALAVTYYATGGPNWTEQLGFLSNDDECTWNNEVNGYFLGSGRCGDDGLIITLALWGNNLVGFLPNEVGALMTLRELSFFDNAIRGPPPRTLHNLSSLGVLYLHKNQFQGDLNFMCDHTIGHFKSDCGKQGGVLCECCTHCGFQSVPDVQASPQYETSPQVVKSPQADASNAHADRFHRLKTLFISSGVTPEEKFVDLTSPQYRALEWMASQDATHLAAHDSNVTKKLIQRYALAVVFFATSGPNWKNDFNFLSDTDECSWGKKINGHLAGVGKCKAGFITVMHLKGNNLGGFLPDEIGALTSLIRVSFFDNSISGKFPTSLQALTSLEKVQLQGNHFQGSLDFLCDNKIDEFISDCGDKGNVECSCCSTCGFKAKI